MSTSGTPRGATVRWSDAEDRRLLLACMALNAKVDHAVLSRVLGNRTQSAVTQRIGALKKEAEKFLNVVESGTGTSGRSSPRRGNGSGSGNGGVGKSNSSGSGSKQSPPSPPWPAGKPTSHNPNKPKQEMAMGASLCKLPSTSSSSSSQRPPKPKTETDDGEISIIPMARSWLRKKAGTKVEKEEEGLE